jgi:hypothetical protein
MTKNQNHDQYVDETVSEFETSFAKAVDEMLKEIGPPPESDVEKAKHTLTTLH